MLDKRMIVFNDFDTVEYYDGDIHTQERAKTFLKRMEKNITYNRNYRLVYNGIDYYYYYNDDDEFIGKCLKFNDEQKKELSNPNSKFSKKMQSLLKISKDKNRYNIIISNKRFNSIDEAIFFIDYLAPKAYSYNFRYYRYMGDKKKIKSARKYVVNNISADDEKYILYFCNRDNEMRLRIFQDIYYTVALSIVFTFLFGMLLLYFYLPSLGTVFSSYLEYVVYMLTSTLLPIYMLFIGGALYVTSSDLKYAIETKIDLKKIRENRSNHTKQKSIVREENEILQEEQVVQEEQLVEKEETKETEGPFKDKILNEIKSIGELAENTLSKEDASEICIEAIRIANEYQFRKKKLNEDVLTIDSELQIKLDITKEIRKLLNDYEKKLNAPSGFDMEVEELKRMLSQNTQEQGVTRILK